MHELMNAERRDRRMFGYVGRFRATIILCGNQAASFAQTPTMASAMETKLTFLSLPHEIIITIASYLDAPSILCLSRVSSFVTSTLHAPQVILGIDQNESLDVPLGI